MADIVFRYQEMRQAAEEIKSISGRYKTAADTLNGAFTEATTGWEGKSKDKLLNFVTGPVNEYISDTIPQLLSGLAELLIANADQMESADDQIAENIPTSLGG